MSSALLSLARARSSVVLSGSSGGNGSSPCLTHIVVDRQFLAIWDRRPYRLWASSFLSSFQAGLLQDCLLHQSVQSKKPVENEYE